MTPIARFLGLLATTLLLALPALAGGLTDMTEAEREAFRKEVRAYLLENPEVLIEAIQVLEARQQAQAAQNDAALIAANREALENDGMSYVGGNPEGDVTVIEFMDYRCPFCRRAHPEVKELLRTDGNIRFIVKEFPILGEQSTLSSRLAIATLRKAGPEAYARIYDFLMTYNGKLTEKSMPAILARLKIEGADEIIAFMDDESVTRQIEETRELARRLQITGTPSFVIGTEMVRGYAPLADMRQIVEYHRGQGG